jgi:signal peptidase I
MTEIVKNNMNEGQMQSMTGQGVSNDNQEKPQKERLISKNVLLWARDIGIALLVALILMQFVKPCIVREHSMEDTLYPDDYIFVSRQAYLFSEPERGDVVVFHSELMGENGVTKNLIKRVIGVPGDTVEIKGGSVYVNGEAIREPYIKEGFTSGEMEKITVPEDMLFLMGDNRQRSKDSRDSDVGFVPKKQLIGKAFFRVYPFDGFGTISS